MTRSIQTGRAGAFPLTTPYGDLPRTVAELKGMTLRSTSSYVSVRRGDAKQHPTGRDRIRSYGSSIGELDRGDTVFVYDAIIRKDFEWSTTSEVWVLIEDTVS